MNDSWVVGDTTGVRFPAHPEALRRGGTRFLTEAFRAWGALDADNEVIGIDRLDEVGGGSTGRKAVLSVRYAQPAPDLRTDLFVKFSRDFDDEMRDVGRTQMESEVRFAALAATQEFPISVPVTQFADYHGESGTGILISERIAFGSNEIEPQYQKCLDDEIPAPTEHYRAIVVALARLAGAYGAGRLSADLATHFPVDLQAATVGERPVRTRDQVDRRVVRLTEFTAAHPGLFAANVRSPQFLSRLSAEVPALLAAEPTIWRMLADIPEHLALCHWNANVDNAWFWRDADGALRCGLMDWGCVSRLNVAMALWGALSAAEDHLWDRHLDELLTLFCEEVRAAGGPRLEPVALREQLVLYAALMGVTWLLDVPALLRARVPDLGPQTTRADPRIRGDEGVRAPLQMLANVLNLWQTDGVGVALRRMGFPVPSSAPIIG